MTGRLPGGAGSGSAALKNSLSGSSCGDVGIAQTWPSEPKGSSGQGQGHESKHDHPTHP